MTVQVIKFGVERETKNDKPSFATTSGEAMVSEKASDGKALTSHLSHLSSVVIDPDLF